ncbi:protein xylosyltransferase [Aureococcus anophagefferens]|nr:protein xylosyltransferase [Aureococcus anophagefferens]
MLPGVVTGSDTAPNRTLSLALQECGVRGEGVIDERAWVVKSHYPERRGCARFAAKRAILLVRNPWDVIDSYFNMTLTNSHNTTMRDDQYARFEELFRGLARAEADVWARFNRWWLRAPIPLLVVRYEDSCTTGTARCGASPGSSGAATRSRARAGPIARRRAAALSRRRRA